MIREFTAESARLLDTLKDRAVAARLKKEAEARASELRRSAAVRLHKQTAAAPVPTASAARLPSVPATNEIAIEAGEIHERDRVKIRSLDREGTVESVNDGEYTILVGSLRFRARREEIQLLKAAAAPASKHAASLPRGVSADVSVDTNFSPEINVIGATVDEATDRVDKFLDEAFMAGAESVRVVHGHGKGALRKAIAELLTGHVHVDRFDSAPPNEGGAGATIVVMKK